MYKFSEKQKQADAINGQQREARKNEFSVKHISGFQFGEATQGHNFRRFRATSPRSRTERHGRLHLPSFQWSSVVHQSQDSPRSHM